MEEEEEPSTVTKLRMITGVLEFIPFFSANSIHVY